LEIVRQNNIPIINDWSIFFEQRPQNLVIGVTGTKGKSTTAALIFHLLKTAKKDAVLCGNIGQSPLAMLHRIKPRTIVVAELSSWLLADFKQSPQIAIITNLMPDHLDKYRSLKEYYQDKKNIFKHQKPTDHLIRNKQDAEAALEVAKILGIAKRDAAKALKTFPGLPGRLELVRTKGGIKYYNDTCATTPDATIYALQRLKEKQEGIILIAGGVDKKLGYKNLTQAILKNTKGLILLPGDASDQIKAQIRKTGNARPLSINYAGSMKEAVQIAKKLASQGDAILLSPAAASFNLFKNEFDRGKQFVKLVR
jgi:UDP-N-acetylmuramoylalanine--D-glutamate ligase